MGQDAWNLQYGQMHPAKYRKGNEVDMHPDEGYGGPKMIPGYAGAYKNWKGKVAKEKSLKSNGNPRTYGSQFPRKAQKKAEENGEMLRSKTMRRK